MTVAEKEREERFDALFRQYLPDMVAYCGWRSGSPADAQDAVSEVFLAAWRRLDEVPAGGDARLWLYGTARKILANQARAGRRRARLSARAAEAWDPEQEVGADTAAAGGGDVSLVVGAVHRALALLAPEDREVLLLAEWEGLTPSHIARVLDCPAVTARGRLFRARRRFRQVYASLPEEPAPSDPVPASSTSRSTQGVVPCS